MRFVILVTGCFSPCLPYHTGQWHRGADGRPLMRPAAVVMIHNMAAAVPKSHMRTITSVEQVDLRRLKVPQLAYLMMIVSVLPSSTAHQPPAPLHHRCHCARNRADPLSCCLLKGPVPRPPHAPTPGPAHLPPTHPPAHPCHRWRRCWGAAGGSTTPAPASSSTTARCATRFGAGPRPPTTRRTDSLSRHVRCGCIAWLWREGGLQLGAVHVGSPHIKRPSWCSSFKPYLPRLSPCRRDGVSTQLDQSDRRASAERQGRCRSACGLLSSVPCTAPAPATSPAAACLRWACGECPGWQGYSLCATAGSSSATCFGQCVCGWLSRSGNWLQCTLLNDPLMGCRSPFSAPPILSHMHPSIHTHPNT